ncbi:hypothetical protein MLD38_030368 [Melastoma candidum]|nr:hypothetical protein MLD38_030368 [Melastoma candidum]
MRLSHLGLPVHLVFDMTTPPISLEDLLTSSGVPGASRYARSQGQLGQGPRTYGAAGWRSSLRYAMARAGTDLMDEGVQFVLFEMTVHSNYPSANLLPYFYITRALARAACPLLPHDDGAISASPRPRASRLPGLNPRTRNSIRGRIPISPKVHQVSSR